MPPPKKLSQNQMLPREKLAKKGAETLTKAELLAIILGTGTKQKNVLQLSKDIIQKTGKNFLQTELPELEKFYGIGKTKALQIIASIHLVQRMIDEQQSLLKPIQNAQDVFALTQDFIKKKKEHLVCLYLNTRGILLKMETISIGLVDRSNAHPREVFSPAIALNASHLILLHNHPSGDASPSDDDISCAKRMTEVGELVGIPMVDFLIVAKNGSYSLKKNLFQQENYIRETTQEIMALDFRGF